MRPLQLRGGLVLAKRALMLASALLFAIGPAAHAPTGAFPRAAGNDAVPEKTNKAIVQAAFEKWRAGGDVFAELLAPDIVWTIHGSGPVAGTYRGLEDFTRRASAPLVSRLAGPIIPEVRSIWADGDVVIVRFDGSATTTSGAPYRNQFVWILRMKAGRAVEAEAFLDLAAYQRVIENNRPRAQ
ncbi:nuclear transport factor 2 family protein [Sphingomonas sp.]|uniref:nuclear transport factor 2 family protein n=1 Tax=Sphingomonas sp. TaxID=28214 RepID=UPI003B3A6F58